jgi:hypothetical protein
MNKMDSALEKLEALVAAALHAYETNTLWARSLQL